MILIVDDMRDFSIEDTLGESFIMCRSCKDALELILRHHKPTDFSEIWLDYNLVGHDIGPAVLALKRFARTIHKVPEGRRQFLPKIRILTDDPEGFDLIEAELQHYYELIEPPASCNELWLKRRGPDHLR
jgi:hypothetical protein